MTNLKFPTPPMQITLVMLFVLLLLIVSLFDEPVPAYRYTADELDEVKQSCIDILTMEGESDVSRCHDLAEQLEYRP